MKESFILLRKEFNNIKKLGLITPLRRGSTGIGYTFETLLNKKEDSECKPDFYGIEVKTKFGYSKSPLTLFHCVPKRNDTSSIKYIFDKYSYPKLKNKNIMLFEREIYSNKIPQKYNCDFKLFVDYFEKRIIMKSYYNNSFLEDVCFWDFKDLERKLKIKLSYLAIIHAYPYRINKKLYYKYLKMISYKLKDFFTFLKLIENDKIRVQFYLKKSINEEVIDNHGVSFRIHNDYINELFVKLPY